MERFSGRVVRYLWHSLLTTSPPPPHFIAFSMKLVLSTAIFLLDLLEFLFDFLFHFFLSFSLKALSRIKISLFIIIQTS